MIWNSYWIPLKHRLTHVNVNINIHTPDTNYTRESCTKCTYNNKSTIHNQDRQSNYGEKKHNKIKNVGFTNNVHKKSLKKPKG